MRFEARMPALGVVATFATLLVAVGAWAVEVTEVPEPSPPPGAPHGILPLEDYTEGLGVREYLLGDLWGARSALAEKGLTFHVDFTQVLQSVTDGGLRETSKYGGTADYLANLDFDRMGLIPGGLLRFRAESKYGNSVNGDSGSAAPVNIDALFPLTRELDEDIPITVTSLNYTQFLSPHFGVLAGKVDTMDGDLNEFASGRGVSQFMNSNLVANGVFVVGLPYSTLVVGGVWMPTPKIDIAMTFGNATDASTTTGFSDIGDSWLISVEGHFQYRLRTLPGGITAGGFYVDDGDFAKLDGQIRVESGELVTDTEDTTGCLYLNLWQYLYVKDTSEAPIDLLNGKPDRQGIGVFFRAGVSDEDTNPVTSSFSGGIGGRGLLPTRDEDWFGVGYFYNHVELNRFLEVSGFDDNAHGVEAFHNIGILPAAHVTFDMQYIDPSIPAADDAVVVGTRLALRF